MTISDCSYMTEDKATKVSSVVLHKGYSIVLHSKYKKSNKVYSNWQASKTLSGVYQFEICDIHI